MSFSSICKYSQVLANCSHAFSRKCKKNHNPFALFATVCWHSYGIHKALLFSVFLPTNHIIFGDFAANFKFSYSPRCESRKRKRKAKITDYLWKLCTFCALSVFILLCKYFLEKVEKKVYSCWWGVRDTICLYSNLKKRTMWIEIVLLTRYLQCACSALIFNVQF